MLLSAELHQFVHAAAERVSSVGPVTFSQCQSGVNPLRLIPFRLTKGAGVPFRLKLFFSNSYNNKENNNKNY